MKKKKTLREYSIIIEKLATLGFLSLFLCKYFIESPLFWYILIGSFLLLVLALVYSTKFYICPNCRHPLPLIKGGIHFCPICGISLEDAHE